MSDNCLASLYRENVQQGVGTVQIATNPMLVAEMLSTRTESTLAGASITSVPLSSNKEHDIADSKMENANLDFMVLPNQNELSNLYKLPSPHPVEIQPTGKSCSVKWYFM
jgi:hypothetical protein